MKNLSNWRSVRVRELAVERDLRQRHHLWLHGWCIGALVLLLMWATAHLQFVLGSESLAIRYLVTLGVGYLAYLGILRFWASALLRRDASSPADLVPDVVSALPDLVPDVSPVLPDIAAGGGGDFGGGGASGTFGDALDAGSGLGEVAGGALEVVAGSDEAAVVVVPVVAVFLIGLAVVLGAGSLMFLYFGSDVLLAVAVELGFGYVSARTAVSIAREGWLSTAVRSTWKPLMGALLCAVLLGATIDFLVPSARSLPQVIKLIGASAP